MSNKLFAKIVVSTFAGGISALFIAQLSLANPLDTGNVNPLQDLQTVDDPDPFSNSGGGLGMFDLLHRSRLGNNRDMTEFTVEQRQNINDAASQFRSRQQQLIQQQEEPISSDNAVSEEGNEIAP